MNTNKKASNILAVCSSSNRKIKKLGSRFVLFFTTSTLLLLYVVLPVVYIERTHYHIIQEIRPGQTFLQECCIIYYTVPASSVLPSGHNVCMHMSAGPLSKRAKQSSRGISRNSDVI